MKTIAISVRAGGLYCEQLRELNARLSDGWKITQIAQMSDGAIFIMEKVCQ